MKKFSMAPDAIDASIIPQKRLYTGAKMPGIGLGTFGSDYVPNDLVAAIVRDALQIGYRYIDCAACYGNEAQVGAVLRDAIDGGLVREELFVLSKLWNDMHAPKDVIASCKQTLHDLRLDYLDCYLVHWPFPNFHAPHCDVAARNPASRPYVHEEFMETWHAMEQLVQSGLVRHIGTSNVTIPKLRLLLRDAEIRPAVNEMELHPCFQQGELYQFCVDAEIVPIGYCPVGSPMRPMRDRTPEDCADVDEPVIKRIALAHAIHPATLCIKWAAARGQVPIPFSTKRQNCLNNLLTICTDPLTVEELDALKSCERNSRLIKGQVFLWNGADTWLDLWDTDGTIPSWNGYEKCVEDE
ncbi:MAG: aldo/keto reductase [Clostridia bacterium]